MKTKQTLALGVLLLALLALLSPTGTVQANRPTSFTPFTKSYNMRRNFGNYTNYRLNMLMTLWGVSPGSKFKDAYLSVPDNFEGQVTIPTGETWLNGVFGPYTHEYGMGDSEVGGVREGGGACDILSFVAETLASAGLYVPKNSAVEVGFVKHPTLIPGVDPYYSLAVSTAYNRETPSSKNGADVRVVNDYGPVVLHWKVEGDTLTLSVSSESASTLPLPQLPGIVPTNVPGAVATPAPNQPTVKAAEPGDKYVSLYSPLKTVATWGFGILTVIWLVYAGPRALLRIGKPKTKGEVARKKDLWRGAIEVAVIVGIIMVAGTYLYAQWQWPDILAYRTRLFRDWLNGTSDIPNAAFYGFVAFWLGSTLLGRLRRARGGYAVTAETKKKHHGQTFVVVTLLVVGILAGMYYIPSAYSPPPAAAASIHVNPGACDGVLLGKLLNGKSYSPPSERQETLNTAILRISPDLEEIYAEAERQTGVPCEVLAGIHFVEANNRPTGSLISGRAIGTSEPDQGGKVYGSLLETAIDAAKILKGKVGLPRDSYAEFTSIEQLITALSRYNGGGNANCKDSYPYNIPYDGCPKSFVGEDDPYAVNWLDERHGKMYLLYCADYTACKPQVFQRPGSFTIAVWFYEQLSSHRVATPTPTAVPSTPTPTPTP